EDEATHAEQRLQVHGPPQPAGSPHTAAERRDTDVANRAAEAESRAATARHDTRVTGTSVAIEPGMRSFALVALAVGLAACCYPGPYGSTATYTIDPSDPRYAADVARCLA